MKLKIFKYKKVNSTNDIAIRKIRSGIKNGIVTSDLQSSGRGRHGNKWVSYKGNLFVTIFFSISNNLNLNKFNYISNNEYSILLLSIYAQKRKSIFR